MPVISTFGALSSRGFGGVGGKPTSFTFNYMGIPTVGQLYDFVVDSSGNYIGIFETSGVTYVIKYNIVGTLLAGKELIATLIPYTNVYVTCLYTDGTNVYLGGNTGQVVKLDNNLNILWSYSYTNISSITSLTAGKDSTGANDRIYVSDGSKILSISTSGTVDNIINGVGAQSGGYVGSNIVTTIVGQNGFGFTLVPYGATTTTNYNYTLVTGSFPFNFTDGIYTFRVTAYSSITSNSNIDTYISGPGVTVRQLYSFTAVWLSGGTVQPTRYYVGFKTESFIVLINQITAPTPTQSVNNWYYTNILEQPTNLAFIRVGTYSYGCYKSNGSTVIFASDGTNIIWSNKLTPSSGDGFETHRIRYGFAGTNAKLYIEGNDGFFVIPADGSIPGDGNYTVNGVNYTYTSVSLTSSFGNVLPAYTATTSSRITGSSIGSITTVSTTDYIPPIITGPLV